MRDRATRVQARTRLEALTAVHARARERHDMRRGVAPATLELAGVQVALVEAREARDGDGGAGFVAPQAFKSTEHHARHE